MSRKVVPVANRLYESNLLTLENYVEKFVTIVTVDGKKFNGTVYTIDPVTESVVLVNKSNGITSILIVMGHAVNNISVTFGGEVYTECEKLYPCSLSQESVSSRRNVEKLAD